MLNRLALQHRGLWLVSLTALSGATTGSLILALTSHISLIFFILFLILLVTLVHSGIALFGDAGGAKNGADDSVFDVALYSKPSEDKFVPALFHEAGTLAAVEKVSLPEHLSA